MTQNDPKAMEVMERFEQARADRASYEPAWEDIRNLVRPHATSFNSSDTKGDVRSSQIFDGTAVQASDDLAGAITSHTTSATERWFSLEVQDNTEANEDFAVVEWMEHVADAIYSQYSNPKSKFNPSIYEANSDLSSFGTANLGQEWNVAGGHIMFRAYPLSETYICEDSDGRVNEVIRELEYSSRQLLQAFPAAEGIEDVTKDTKNQKSWTVIHAVYPRRNRDSTRYDAQNKRFASCWVLKDKKILLKEGGYDGLPYHVGRWAVMAGEVYGRGPAIKCLPDIRMLNRMEYTIIKAAQRAVMPPLLVPSDGYFGSIKTRPDSINFYEPGSDPIIPLEYKGQIQIGLEMSNQKREFIRQCFFGDWVKFNQKNERQTAYEISELVDQQLRMMGAVVGRLQDEVLGPMLERSYNLLREHRMLPPAPAMLQNQTLKIVYISQAARAQVGSKATSMSRYLQELIPLAQIQPSVMDAIDMDKYAQELAMLRGISPTIRRDPKSIEAMRADRAQQEQMQAIAQNLEPASKAVKNLADANATGAAVT